MHRPAAITALHAFAWLFLILGTIAAIGIFLLTLSNQTVTGPAILLPLAISAGALVGSIFMWALLSTLAHIADTLLDIRDQGL